ncbi:hypothetical protein [Nocardia sp. JMUB6875]|uniref:hypothetical protein n=1 Tax=Nocardia sp. JMUB6875 TaxID=3158170 RepID=UPI0034E8AA1C
MRQATADCAILHPGNLDRRGEAGPEIDHQGVRFAWIGGDLRWETGLFGRVGVSQFELPLTGKRGGEMMLATL